jgi:hypothetical protein
MDTRIFSYKPAMHAISAAFIERGAGAHEAQVETSLAVHFLESLPFEASSTMIRDALAGTGPRSDLAILPYTSYVDIKALKLYRAALIPGNTTVAPIPAFAHAARYVACVA